MFYFLFARRAIAVHVSFLPVHGNTAFYFLVGNPFLLRLTTGTIARFKSITN